MVVWRDHFSRFSFQMSSEEKSNPFTPPLKKEKSSLFVVSRDKMDNLPGLAISKATYLVSPAQRLVVHGMVALYPIHPTYSDGINDSAANMWLLWSIKVEKECINTDREPW